MNLPYIHIWNPFRLTWKITGSLSFAQIEQRLVFYQGPISDNKVCVRRCSSVLFVWKSNKLSFIDELESPPKRVLHSHFRAELKICEYSRNNQQSCDIFFPEFIYKIHEYIITCTYRRIYCCHTQLNTHTHTHTHTYNQYTMSSF